MSDAEPSAYRTGLIYLVATALGWGFNWPVIKLILHDWPPLFGRGVSGLVAASILMVLALYKGEALRVPVRLCGRLCVAAAINVFAWMGFTTLALRWLSVAEAALLVYSMPIWVILLAWPLLGEKPSLRNAVAVVAGILGLVVLMGGGASLEVGKIYGIVLTLAAAILFALGTLTMRNPIPLPPLALTAWQVGLGCIPMVLIGLVFEHPHFAALSATGLLGLIYMSLGPMMACYLGWFAVLRRLPSSTAAIGMLLVPIVGTGSAAFVFGDRLGLREIVAFALTLGGVFLALYKGGRRRSETVPVDV